MATIEEFGAPLKEVQFDDKTKAILIDPERGQGSSFDKNRNIIKVNKKGEVVWVIQSCAIEDEVSPYTNIYLSDDHKFKAFSWNGIEVTLDMETGKIVEEVMKK